MKYKLNDSNEEHIFYKIHCGKKGKKVLYLDLSELVNETDFCSLYKKKKGELIFDHYEKFTDIFHCYEYTTWKRIRY